MTGIVTSAPTRRALLAGISGAGALLWLPGCASTGPVFSMEEAVRRLLLAASENAFARLTEPGGYWDAQVASIGLNQFLGSRGNTLSRILTSQLFKDRLEERFASFAIEASFRAAPVVTDAVEVIGFANALELVRGGPSAASDFLRLELGSALCSFESWPQLFAPCQSCGLTSALEATSLCQTSDARSLFSRRCSFVSGLLVLSPTSVGSDFFSLTAIRLDLFPPILSTILSPVCLHSLFLLLALGEQSFVLQLASRELALGSSCKKSN